MKLKITFCYLLVVFTLTTAFAQDAKDFISKHRFKLMEEKPLKPIQSVKLNLEIETKDGKFPATLWILENMIYKLEMVEPKGKSIEFIDQQSYKLISASGKEKQIGETNSELHFRKKLWLNFYPLLSSREDAPMKMLEPGMDMNGNMSITAPVLAVDAPPSEDLDPSLKKIVQPLPFNDMAHIFLIDMKTMHLVRVETRYYQEGQEKFDKVVYGPYAKSPEGYSYPTTFTTAFGKATVKSIQFNQKLNPADLEVKF